MAPLQERERQRELELIKQQYLGAEKQKKKILKATERMKFVFDWDAEEDTSRDLNPLYQNLHGGRVPLGRVVPGSGEGWCQEGDPLCRVSCAAGRRSVALAISMGKRSGQPAMEGAFASPVQRPACCLGAASAPASTAASRRRWPPRARRSCCAASASKRVRAAPL
jgi:hypothetical protein